jgi:hypothetical protein
MKNNTSRNKVITFVAAGLFVLTGTYNAIVINSESHISSADMKFVKRLDEVYGVTVRGREVAASLNWQKLAPSQIVPKKVQPIYKQAAQSSSTPSSADSSEILPVAAVQEELSLSLVEVINPKKWQQPLQASQFSGELATNSGVIQNLSVALPNGEGVSVSFSEMTGNVFEYDLNGELYSGMMYQVDQNSYMVTMTNGPLEGTRLRFSSDAPPLNMQQPQETVADNNVDPQQTAGQDLTAAPEFNPDIQAQEIAPEQMAQTDQQFQQEAVQAPVLDPNQSQQM